MNRPTFGWRYGTVAWVTDCGRDPHYHVIQLNSNVCLADAGGVESLRDMLVVVADLLRAKSYRFDEPCQHDREMAGRTR